MEDVVTDGPPAAAIVTPDSLVLPLAEVGSMGTVSRPTGVGELDRVLGGGLVAGSVTLIGGEPGIGKSTLVLQALAQMAEHGARCLLVTGEESPEQVRARAQRLHALPASLLVVAETSLPCVLAHAGTVRPDVLAIDSVQTLHDPDSAGAAGSVTQVRDGAARVVRYAKEHNLATLLVGHVTKDGALAGPRALEHVVDTVLSFDGDRHHALRMLRATKHRFGPTDELGVLEMAEQGLRGVPDASAMFLADRQPGACGSVIAPVMDGNRPLLVELQALVSPTKAPLPRRVAHALDNSRVSMLTAVLQRWASVQLADNDVYTSVAGGARVAEPGADLALALAIAAAANNRAVPGDTVVLGEVGLGGEVRQVAHAPRRLAEAARLGFTRAVVPQSTPDVPGIRLFRVTDLCASMRVLQKAPT
ncbi:MAG: repair protein RadA [Actinomycetia bacterium]|nr:repair protein RadA [Actinomycetes bacterium]